MKVLTVRLDEELHEKIRTESFKANKSMNEIIVEQLFKRYEEEKGE